MSKNIAIVGGGPKAVAVCALVEALAKVGMAGVPSVDVWEPYDFGAYWSGRNGYTDGLRLLCTAPSRDIGFPYGVSLQRREIVAGNPYDFRIEEERITDEKSLAAKYKDHIFQNYSWQQFCRRGVEHSSTFSRKKLGYSFNFDEWVAKDHTKPTHEFFASYLSWAMKKALESKKVNHVKAAVERISHDGRDWIIIDGEGQRSKKYHAVVFTGSHERSIGDKSLIDVAENINKERYFTGSDFWP